jgi:hypothetical protein
MQPVYVATNPHEKAMQRALIQYRNPKNYELVREALVKAGREDLIGFDKKCLIRPRKPLLQKNKSGNNFSDKQPNNKNNKIGKTENRQRQDSKKPVKKKTIRNVHKKAK